MHIFIVCYKWYLAKLSYTHFFLPTNYSFHDYKLDCLSMNCSINIYCDIKDKTRSPCYANVKDLRFVFVIQSLLYSMFSLFSQRMFIFVRFMSSQITKNRAIWKIDFFAHFHCIVA